MEKLNIYQKILLIMKDVDYVQKEKKKVNGQYTFVSHDTVASVIHPQLVKHGVMVVPTVIKWEQDGNRTSAVMAVDFVNADDPSDRFSVQSFGFGVDTGDKGPGKSMSYAYKYALLKTFCLETGDDPDADATSKYVPSSGTKVQGSEDCVDEIGVSHILSVISDDKVLEKTFLTLCGIEKIMPNSIPKEKARRAIKTISEMKRGMA